MSVNKKGKIKKEEDIDAKDTRGSNKRKAPTEQPKSNKKIKVKTEDTEKDDQVLLIRNLPFVKPDETTTELTEKFSKQEVFVARKGAGNCKGYAFVRFEDSASALAAKEEFNGSEICGRKIFIDFAAKNSLEDQFRRKVKSEIKDESENQEGNTQGDVKIKAEQEDTEVATSENRQKDSKVKVKKEIKREPKEKDPRKAHKEARARAKLIRLQINRELDVCVKKRDVKSAERLFGQFEERGLEPDAFAYTHMINISARYGNMDRADSYFNDMNTRGVKANVVTFTAYIKGLVMWGRMEDAVKVLEAMKEKQVNPNYRTYNTLLRGCLKDGNVDLAVELFAAAKQQKSKDALDITSYVYVMMCHCYALRTHDAWDIAKDLNAKTITPAVAKAYASLAVAEAVAGNPEKAKSALQKAEACLARITGKSAPKDKTDSESDNGSESEETASIAQNKKGTKPKNAEEIYKEIDAQAKTETRAESVRKGPAENFEGTSYELFTLAQKEEIIAMCKVVEQFLDGEKATPFPKIKNMEESNKMTILPPKNEVFPVKLRYGSLFNKMTTPANRPRDIKLEICSGLGDWVVYQAKRSPDVNWIAAEIRHERVFQIWSKAALEGLDNLFVVETDARLLLNKYIPPDSLREVFINFPEPPSNENKNMHLLTIEFLKEINAVLQRHGKLVVATDSFQLAHQLTQDLQSLNNIYKSTMGAHPFASHLPINYGSSYFDKFWTQGQRHNRYYFEYKKIWAKDKE